MKLSENERKVVHYKRVSTDRGHVDAQDEMLQTYQLRHPGEQAIILEGVESGRRMDGPQFQKLWSLVAEDKVSKVVVLDYHRIGRNVMRSLEFVKLCHDHGTEIVSVLEPLDISTPEGWQRLMHKMTDAEYYLRRLSLETSRGLAAAKRRGDFTGGSKGKWMSQRSARIVHEVFRLWDGGTPKKRIAEYLGLSEKTVAKYIRQRADLPAIRERLWDA